MSAHTYAAVPPATTPRERLPRRRVQRARDYLAGWIPFTDAFAAHSRLVAQERMGAFRGRDLLDAALRDELDNRVAALELRLARMELRRRCTLFLIALLSFVTWGVYTYVVVPQYVIKQLEAAMTGGVLAANAVPLLVGFAMALVATVAVVAGAHRLLSHRFGARTTVRLELGVLAFFYVAWAANGVLNAWSVSESPLLFLAALYLCGAVAFALTAAVTWVVMARASRLYRGRAAALWPDAVMVHELLAVLVRLEEGTGKRGWMEMEARRDMLRRLERAACTVERCLPRRLRHEDPGNDAWLRQTTREIAAALRQMKRGLCLSDAGTREELVRRLTDALVHTIRGEWSRLERAECPPPAPSKRRPVAQVAAHALLFAGMAAVLVLDQSRPVAALMGLAGNVLKEASGLLLPLVAPVLAYTILKALSPGAMENVEVLGKLVGKK